MAINGQQLKGVLRNVLALPILTNHQNPAMKTFFSKVISDGVGRVNDGVTIADLTPPTKTSRTPLENITYHLLNGEETDASTLLQNLIDVDGSNNLNEFAGPLTALGIDPNGIPAKHLFAGTQYNKYLIQQLGDIELTSPADDALLAKLKANDGENLISKIRDSNQTTSDDVKNNFLLPKIRALRDPAKSIDDIKATLGELGVQAPDQEALAKDYFAKNQYKKYFIDHTDLDQIELASPADDDLLNSLQDPIHRDDLIQKIKNSPETTSDNVKNNFLLPKIRELRDSDKSVDDIKTTLNGLGVLTPGNQETVARGYFAKNQYEKYITNGTDENVTGFANLEDSLKTRLKGAGKDALIAKLKGAIPVAPANATTDDAGRYLTLHLQALRSNTSTFQNIIDALDNLGVTPPDATAFAKTYFAQNQFEKYIETSPDAINVVDKIDEDEDGNPLPPTAVIPAVPLDKDSKNKTLIDSLKASKNDIIAKIKDGISTATATTDSAKVFIQGKIQELTRAPDVNTTETLMRELGMLPATPTALSDPEKEKKNKIFAENQLNRLLDRASRPAPHPTATLKSPEDNVLHAQLDARRTEFINKIGDVGSTNTNSSRKIDAHIDHLKKITTNIADLTTTMEVLGLDHTNDNAKAEILAENRFNHILKKYPALESTLIAKRNDVIAHFTANPASSLNEIETDINNIIHPDNPDRTLDDLENALSTLGLNNGKLSRNAPGTPGDLEKLDSNIKLQNMVDTLPANSPVKALLNYRGGDNPIIHDNQKITIRQNLKKFALYHPNDVGPLISALKVETNLKKAYDLLEHAKIIDENLFYATNPDHSLAKPGIRSAKYTPEGTSVKELLIQATHYNYKVKEAVRTRFDSYETQVNAVVRQARTEGFGAAEEIKAKLNKLQPQLQHYADYLEAELKKLTPGTKSHDNLNNKLNQTNALIEKLSTIENKLNPTKTLRDGRLYLGKGEDTEVKNEVDVGANYGQPGHIPDPQPLTKDNADILIEQFLNGQPAANAGRAMISVTAGGTIPAHDVKAEFDVTHPMIAVEMTTSGAKDNATIKTLALVQKKDQELTAMLVWRPPDVAHPFKRSGGFGPLYPSLPDDRLLSDAMKYIDRILETAEAGGDLIKNPFITIPNASAFPSKDHYEAVILYLEAGNFRYNKNAATYHPSSERVLNTYVDRVRNSVAKGNGVFRADDVDNILKPKQRKEIAQKTEPVSTSTPTPK